MVPARQALIRAFALAAAAGDEYERRLAAHALYYALFHCAGEALADKTAGQLRPFYWRGRYPDGRRVLKPTPPCKTAGAIIAMPTAKTAGASGAFSAMPTKYAKQPITTWTTTLPPPT